jgi:orotidine-5'-phosphate decarboxylase
MIDSGAPLEVRRRLGLALDLHDLSAALELAKLLAPWFGVAKVGPELFVSAGPDAVRALAAEGFEVFLDLKLHDIPTTVGRGAEQAGRLGTSYLTVHAAGGTAMVRAAVDGFTSGRDRAVLAGVASVRDPSGILGVTVLTSEADAPSETLRARAEVAASTGCTGVVCAAGDVAVVRRAVPDLLVVVPGIRLHGASADDQERTATPEVATTAGAGLLVVGRTVTGADDPVASARRVAAEVELALVESPR